MRKAVIVLLVLLLSLVAIGNVVAQGGGTTWQPQVAYAFILPLDNDEEIIARALGDVGLGYLLPLTNDGEHNLKVGALGGGSPGDEGFANAGFKLGYAYAAEEVPNVIFGLVAAFDAVFPTTDLALKATGDEDKTSWLMLGVEGSLDFTTPGGLPGSLVVGYNEGLRDAPSKFYFAFGVTLKPTEVESTVKRSK